MCVPAAEQGRHPSDTEQGKAEVLSDFLPLSFLVRLAFRNAGLQRPGGKSEARKMYAWWKRINSGNT